MAYQKKFYRLDAADVRHKYLQKSEMRTHIADGLLDIWGGDKIKYVRGARSEDLQRAGLCNDEGNHR